MKALTFEKPGIHETHLRRHFKQFDIGPEQEPWPGPLCIMVFMNRSGSSMVSEHLRATDQFTGFGEPLNYELVLKRKEQHGLESFADYFQWLRENVYREGTLFGLKASCDQVMMLLRSGAIPHLFPEVRWVVMERNDVLSQAISLSIAHQTKQWQSFQKGVSGDVQYDFRAIQASIRQIVDAYGAMNILVSLLGIRPYRVQYEDFIEDPQAATRALASALGVEGANVDVAKLRMRKQRTSRNEEFRERFVRDYLASQSIAFSTD